METFESRLSLNSQEAHQNENAMLQLCDQLDQLLQEVASEGQEKYKERHLERGKLLARTRIELLLDPGSPFLELMPLAGLDQKEMTLGGSLIIGLGKVQGIWVLINANVPTEKGGALNEISVLKNERMDQIALENKLPVIYLNESAGADLSQQAKIFNRGGRAFREITRRSKLGIPSVTVVFGSSTAGGAYVPGMSDYVIMVKNQAKAYLAGPPLVKMALGEDADDESLGGAMMHATKSGLCDFVAEDEKHGLALAREVMGTFKHCYHQRMSASAKAPHFSCDDLLKIINLEGKSPFDVREIIARLVDESKFFEFKPLYGDTLVTAFAEIAGRPVGILANNGVIFKEAAQKGAHFIELCRRQKRPLLFLQNITGFMVGTEAEQGGIIKEGAKLINAVSNSELPCITLMIHNSYGAGNYGMCGRSYDPRFLFSWPNAKLAVMGADQLAGVLETLQKQKAQKGFSVKGMVDQGKLKLIKETLRKQVNEQSHAHYATSRVWDDGIIDPRDTRDILAICLEVIYQESNTQAGDWGVFRM